MEYHQDDSVIPAPELTPACLPVGEACRGPHKTNNSFFNKKPVKVLWVLTKRKIGVRLKASKGGNMTNVGSTLIRLIRNTSIPGFDEIVKTKRLVRLLRKLAQADVDNKPFSWKFVVTSEISRKRVAKTLGLTTNDPETDPDCALLQEAGLVMQGVFKKKGELRVIICLSSLAYMLAFPDENFKNAMKKMDFKNPLEGIFKDITDHMPDRPWLK